MTVYAITDTKKGRTWIAPTYLQTTRQCITPLVDSHTCDKYQVAHPVFLSDVLNDVIGVTSKISVVQSADRALSNCPTQFCIGLGILRVFSKA